MNPVGGISELIRLLRLSAQDKTTGAKSYARAHSQRSSAGEGAPQSQSIDQLAARLRSRIQEAEAAGSLSDSIDLFIETVLEWKFRDHDGDLDIPKLAAQVKDILSSDPAVEAELKGLLDKL